MPGMRQPAFRPGSAVSETAFRPAGIRYLAGLYFLTSAVCWAIVHSSGATGTFNWDVALFLAISTLLAGIGLWNYWRSGRNAAIVTHFVGILVGSVVLQNGSRSGVLIIALNVCLLGYILWVASKSGFVGSSELEITQIAPGIASYRFANLLGRGIMRRANLILFVSFLSIVVYWAMGLGHAKDYASKENHFRIAAPEGWVIAEEPQTGAEVSLVRPDPANRSVIGQPCVSVYVTAAPDANADLGPSNLQPWRAGWAHLAHSPVLPTLQPATVAGNPAWKMDLRRAGSGQNPAERWWLFAIKNQGSLYTLRCASPENIDILPECEKVLNAFGFTP